MFGTGFLLGHSPARKPKDCSASESQTVEKTLTGPITISRTTHPDLLTQSYQIAPTGFIHGDTRSPIYETDPQKPRWTITFADGKTVILAEEVTPSP